MESVGSSVPESQFPRAEVFEAVEVNYPEGILDVRDVRPETLREEKDTPLVSILGFGTGNVALARTASELRDSGVHFMGIDIVGAGPGVKGEKGSSDEYNRQGEMLFKYLSKYLEDNPEMERVDFLAQSAGILRVHAMLSLHPEFKSKIRNFIMEAPVGLYEKDDLLGPLRLGMRFRNEDKRYKSSDVRSPYADENDANLKIANERQMRLSNPSHLKRAAKEVWALSRSDIYPFLEELKEAGIKIGVIQGNRDKLASLEALLKRVGKGYESPIEKSDETPSGFKWVERDNKIPPIDVVRIVGGGFYRYENEAEQTGMIEIPGGHGIQVDSPESAAKSIIGVIDHLNKAA